VSVSASQHGPEAEKTLPRNSVRVPRSETPTAEAAMGPGPVDHSRSSSRSPSGAVRQRPFRQPSAIAEERAEVGGEHWRARLRARACAPGRSISTSISGSRQPVRASSRRRLGVERTRLVAPLARVGRVAVAVEFAHDGAVAVALERTGSHPFSMQPNRGAVRTPASKTPACDGTTLAGWQPAST
jgi:hypothetical protein